jgi:VanZ family protein
LTLAGLTAICWLVAFAGTHMPPGGASRFDINDKVIHFGMFLVLGFLLTLTFASFGMIRKRRLILVVALLAGYAIIDETTQPLVGRGAELLDFVADMAGLAVAAVLAELTIALLARRSRRGYPSQP